MKKFAFFAAILIGFYAYAQEPINKVAKTMDRSKSDSTKPWTLLGTGALNVTQTSFTNWSAGGQNSIGVGSLINLKADYKKNKHAWKNNLDLAYGFQFLGKGKDAAYTKTDDKLEYTVSYGYALSNTWDMTLLVNFKTQFTNGYNYPNDSIPISKFMAPAYLVAGLGVNYVPASYFTVYTSLSAGRFTFVLDDSLSHNGAFGVDKNKNIKGEFGPYIRAVFNKELIKNVTLSSSLELFSDYLKKFGNVDVNWNMLFVLKVNKWLSTTINAQLIYDDDVKIKDGDKVGPRTQFKEVIGLGITYTLKH